MFGLSLNRLLIGSFLIFILCLLQYRLWFASDGVSDMVHLKRFLSEQKEANQQLKKNNDLLLLQIQQSQHSKVSVEAKAREDLGMIKKGEIFYQIVK